MTVCGAFHVDLGRRVTRAGTETVAQAGGRRPLLCAAPAITGGPSKAVDALDVLCRDPTRDVLRQRVDQSPSTVGPDELGVRVELVAADDEGPFMRPMMERWQDSPRGND